MKLIPVSYYGFTAMDRRFSSPMLPWIVSEIRKRDYCEKLSLGVEDGILQAYNQDFELQFSHKVWQITRFSQADQDPTTFLYLMRDDHDTLLYCYLFQAKKASDVLHVIDNVLDPMISIPMRHPTAYDFIQHPYKWKLGSNSIRIFTKKIMQHGNENLYKRDGGHTFLIPIDKKIDDYRRENIDSYIIDGHIIPNKVLFLRPTPKNFIYETVANGDFINIVVDFFEMFGRSYLKSYTVVGNSNHRKGEMIVEIIKANIPVSNGVIHLISQPLAVFDRELKPFPYLPVYYKISTDPMLNQTFEIGERVGINSILKNDSVIFTYFVPRDRGWGNYFRYSNDDFGEVLGRHLVIGTKRYTMEDLVDMSERFNGTTLRTLSGSISFVFKRIGGEFWIFWNDKRVRVVRPNYQCTDGIVHILEEPFSHIENLVYVKPQQMVPAAQKGFWRSVKSWTSKQMKPSGHNLL